ncbi:hypothetical protein CKY12_10270 [Photorhabdus sp. S12-55]|nr:hypothetical protein CKY09_15925 [Photorhabdus sp. S5P8-50]RAW85442.1 hypothetical protein CKY12_10270 [Photorhabdus sp. S12-55]
MSCCPGLRIPSVNIPFCGYLTTQGEFTGTLQLIARKDRSNPSDYERNYKDGMFNVLNGN